MSAPEPGPAGSAGSTGWPDPLAAPASDAPAPDAAPEAPATASRLHLHMPVDVRSASLSVLAVLATLMALHAASAVFLPLLLGLMLSYALSPAVDRLQRLRVPRALGAAVLLVSIAGTLGWTAYTLSDEASNLIASLPAATQKVREAVQAQRGQKESAIDKVQRAANELEQVAQPGPATAGNTPSAAPRGVTRVSIEPAHFSIKDYLLAGTLGLAASAGQVLVVFFIAFFLMSSGNSFRRKLVKITGPNFAQRRLTVELLDEVTAQIHRYLLVQVFTSAVVGLCTGLAFLAIGLEHAAVWGVAAFCLDFIPYIGATVIFGSSSLVAFVQFGTLDMALLTGGLAMLVAMLSGNLLAPWLNSRSSQLSAVTVFVGVLAFGWLWGIWGLFLGVPVLATIKAVCDRVEELKPLGELLGG